MSRWLKPQAAYDALTAREPHPRTLERRAARNEPLLGDGARAEDPTTGRAFDRVEHRADVVRFVRRLRDAGHEEADLRLVLAAAFLHDDATITEIAAAAGVPYTTAHRRLGLLGVPLSIVRGS